MKVLCSLSLFSISLLINQIAYADGVDWESLSQQQQDILSPMKDIWNQLPSQRQERLIKGSKRWTEMPPEKKMRLQERLNRFNDLSDHDKAVVEERIKTFRALPPERREALQNKWQHLDPDKKRAYRERMDQSSERGKKFKDQRKSHKNKKEKY